MDDRGWGWTIGEWLMWYRDVEQVGVGRWAGWIGQVGALGLLMGVLVVALSQAVVEREVGGRVPGKGRAVRVVEAAAVVASARGER
jgi:hypothetical protein